MKEIMEEKGLAEKEQLSEEELEEIEVAVMDHLAKITP